MVKNSRKSKSETYNKLRSNKWTSHQIEKTLTVNKEKEDYTTCTIGHFGKWQLKISILMSLLKFTTPWFQLSIVFLAPPQQFWCEKPSFLSHLSEKEWRSDCKPKNEENPCLIYDPLLLQYVGLQNKNIIPLVLCEKFVYDKSVFTHTIISEWDLVCSRAWLVHLCQCFIMWGVLLGGFIFGILADRYGRKSALMVAIFIQSITTFLACIVPTYWGFVFVKTLCSFASGGINIISFVFCMEIVSGFYRTTIPVLYQMPFGMGNSFIAMVAYYNRDWRQMELIMGFISSLFISYIWLIPESPRFLLAMGQTEKAKKILKSIAFENGIDSSKFEYLDHLTYHPTRKPKLPSFVDFFRSTNLRTKTLLLCGNWFFIGMSFFAFAQYLGQIGSNIFFTVAITGLISTPCSLLCVLIVTRASRKATVASSQIVTGICFFLLLFIKRDAYYNDWPRMVIAGIGLGGIAATVPALYLFTGELYPTIGRNVGVGGVSMFARIGSMVAPVLVSLDRIDASIPLILLALCSVIQIVMLLPLPETKGLPLPETLSQAERFATASPKKIGQLSKSRSKPSNRSKKKRKYKTVLSLRDIDDTKYYYFFMP